MKGKSNELKPQLSLHQQTASHYQVGQAPALSQYNSIRSELHIDQPSITNRKLSEQIPLINPNPKNKASQINYQASYYGQNIAKLSCLSADGVLNNLNHQQNLSSRSMSENIDDDEDICRLSGPKKPNEDLSNQKAVTSVVSGYGAQDQSELKQDLYKIVSMNSKLNFQEFSPEQIERKNLFKYHNSSNFAIDCLNETSEIVIKDFNLNSIDKQLKTSVAFQSKKNLHQTFENQAFPLQREQQNANKTSKKYQANGKLNFKKNGSISLYEDRPLQMPQNSIKARQTLSKKNSNSDLKLATQNFERMIFDIGSESKMLQKQGGTTKGYQGSLQKGLMSTKQVKSKNTYDVRENHKLKRVRSLISAQEKYSLFDHTQVAVEKSNIKTNELLEQHNVKNLQFQFGIHRPTQMECQKERESLHPYYSPTHQNASIQKLVRAQNVLSSSCQIEGSQIKILQEKYKNENSEGQDKNNERNPRNQNQRMLYTHQNNNLNLSSDNDFYQKNIQINIHMGLESRDLYSNAQFDHANTQLEKMSIDSKHLQNSTDYKNKFGKYQIAVDSQNFQLQTETGSGLLKYAKLSNLAFKRKAGSIENQRESNLKSTANLSQKLFGSPHDKMSFYNFTQVAKPDAKSDNSLGGKDFNYEESLCITEENRFQNEINPIKLADLDWGDRYKLDKLLKLQIQLVTEGNFDPNTYFGYDYLMIEEAFQWFDIARRDQEVQLLKRKSSAGFAQNTFVNQSLADFGAGASMFKLQTKNYMGANQINERGFSVLMRSSNGFEKGTLIGAGFNQGLASPTELNCNDPYFNMNMIGTESSSDDEGGDEAEKFKNTFLNNKSASKYLMMKTKLRNENNLLLKTLDQNKASRDSQEEESNYADEMEEEKENYENRVKNYPLKLQDASPQVDEDYNNRTPKVLSSNENSEDEKEDRPLQIRTNFKVLEELIEESREESMRADSVQQIRIPLIENSRCSAPKVQCQVIMDNDDLEELKQEENANGPPQGTHRLYDSDIFVMSNTTFDEDLPSLSSRRVSMGQKQPFRNEFLSFVDNSQDLSALKGMGLNSSQIEQITNQLFTQQQQNQIQNRKNRVEKQDLLQEVQLQSQIKSYVSISNQHKKSSRSREKPLTTSIQTLLQQDRTCPSSNLQSMMHEKKQSLTKFSNYLSSSNNLSPIPFAIQNNSSFFQFKNGQASLPGIRNQSQYNSLSSINFGYHRQQPSVQNSQVFNVNSGHFSILSGGNCQLKQNMNDQNSHQFINQQNNFNLKNRQRQSIDGKKNNPKKTNLPQAYKKISYHSPQCSMSIQANLSPGPGYKIRERNSLNQERHQKIARNKSVVGNIALHLSDSDISKSKFIILQGSQQQKYSDTIRDKAIASSQNYSLAKSKCSEERLINLTNEGYFNKSKYSAFQNQNSTTIDSIRPNQRSNKTLGSSELKKQLNQAQLRKQKSDTKIDNSAALMFEGANSMITQKLLASIKQNVINKKLQNRNEQIMQNQTAKECINDSPQEQQEASQSLNRQRSKSEIDTVYEIGSLAKQMPRMDTKKGKKLNQQISTSPSKSIRSVGGFPYNNGKTMSDINKFYEERSEHNISIQSQTMHRQINNPSINSQLFSQENRSKQSDSVIFSQKVSQSVSGYTVLKEPSVDILGLKRETFTSADQSLSPQIKHMKSTASQQSLNLNFGIQPHLVKKYQSPTAQMAQAVSFTNIVSSGFHANRSVHDQVHNDSIAQTRFQPPSKTKSIPSKYLYSSESISQPSNQPRQQFENSNLNQLNKKQNAVSQISVIKQRIVRSPNKKSMMVLNSSMGSSGNNVSLVHVASSMLHESKQQMSSALASRAVSKFANSNISSGVNTNYNSAQTAK